MSRRASVRFLNACGLSTPLRVTTKGPDGAFQRDFRSPFLLAGRSPVTDLPLGHESVSQRHAYFQAIEGGVFCVDLGSRSGVGLSRDAGRSGWVSDRSPIRIGPFRVLFAGVGVPDWPDDPLKAKPPEEWATPAAFVQLPERPGKPAWRLTRLLTLVGSSRECWLRLAHPSVSKFHCSLVQTRTGLWAVDLLGRGGILANGRRVRSKRLADGDELQLGSFLVRFRFQAPGTPGSSRPAAFGGAALPATRAPGPFPAWPDVGASPGAVEVSGPLPDPPPHAFGQMQQMVEQFQQAMMMMAQMFAALHRDQAALIREELARLQQLNERLASLQGSVAAPASVTLPLSSSGPGPSDAAIAEALARIEALLAGKPPQPAGPSPPGIDPSNDPGASPPFPTAREPGSPRNGPVPAASAPRATHNDGIHALVTMRIAELQQERQSRWQRVVELMTRR